MLIYPTIKQSPMTGMVGYGGGSSGLNVTGGGCAFEDGDAGLADSGHFWRLGSETNPHLDAGYYNSDLDFTTFEASSGSLTANTGPDCNMPPGMTNSLYAPNAADILTSGTLGSHSATWDGSDHFFAFIYPTAHVSMMKPCMQWKDGQNYWLFVTDSYLDNWRYDWPSSNSYDARSSEDVSWNSSQMLLNTWNFIRFGRAQDSGNWGVRLTCQTWNGSSWSLRCNLWKQTAAQISNGNGARFRVMEGIPGYLGNCGFHDGQADTSSPPSS